MLVILAFRKLRQEDLRFEDSLKDLAASARLVCIGLTKRPCLNKEEKRKKASKGKESLVLVLV